MSGAILVDGYRNAMICDVILQLAETGRPIDIRYED
jgi:hypothetical protein